MLNTNEESISNKEKDKKIMMLKFTYEQVLATQYVKSYKLTFYIKNDNINP